MGSTGILQLCKNTFQNPFRILYSSQARSYQFLTYRILARDVLEQAVEATRPCANPVDAWIEPLFITVELSDNIVGCSLIVVHLTPGTSTNHTCQQVGEPINQTLWCPSHQ